MRVKAKDSAWVLPALVLVGLGVLLGCDTHAHSVDAAKPAGETQPLFTPVAATLAQQKMCDEQAGKQFSEDRPKSKSYISGYTSHYDPAVNVCYIRLSSTGGNPPAVVDTVLDAFGGRTYAQYMWINSQNKKYSEVSPFMCEIDIPGKPKEACKSSDEFDELTEKYFGVTR